MVCDDEVCLGLFLYALLILCIATDALVLYRKVGEDVVDKEDEEKLKAFFIHN